MSVKIRAASVAKGNQSDQRQQGLRDHENRNPESGFLFFSFFFHVVSSWAGIFRVLPNARQKITCKAEVVASSKAQKFFATPALPFTSTTGAIRSAAITWMTVRDALSTVSAEVRARTLETVRAQLVAMIVELVPKVGGREDEHDVSEDDSPDLKVPRFEDHLWSPDESDEEGKVASRASIHTGGPLHRHRKRPRGPGQTTADE